MIILLTNDDGIESAGILAMADVLTSGHEVWMVAPDIERSGTSHAITLRDAVRISEIRTRTYACGGTPADCVLFALLGAIPVKPDVVISGINHGANLGTDIIYSGTAAAARQAALMDRPSIAVSLVGGSPPNDFRLAARFVEENLSLLVGLWSPDHFINVNVPDIELCEPDGRTVRVQVTHPTRRIYRDHLVDFTAPSGDKYYFLQGSLVESGLEEGSDWAAVSGGRISVSAVHLHPLKHEDDAAYRGAVFREPAL